MQQQPLVLPLADRPDHDQQHCYLQAPTVKPEAATAVVELLMMGVRTPETCSAVNERQVVNWRNCCIQLVDLFESFVNVGYKWCCFHRVKIRKPAAVSHCLDSIQHNVLEFRLTLPQKQRIIKVKKIHYYLTYTAAISSRHNQLYTLLQKKSMHVISKGHITHLTLRRLMSYIYIYMEHPFLMFLDHTQRRSTVGRTPLDE